VLAFKVSSSFAQAVLGPQPFSSWSHLLAAGAALAAGVPLVRLGRGNLGRICALAVFVATVIAALATSGVYHGLSRGEPARLFMQRLDHYAIWGLIAGTFTAVHGTMCRGFWRWGLLSIIWSYAAFGVVLQIAWFERFSGNLGLALYLGLGWMGVGSIVKLGGQIGFRRVLPILYAGLAFSAGAILEAFDWPTLVRPWFGAHEIFHLAVIAGVGLLWLFIRTLMLHHLPVAAPALAPSAERPGRRTES
jgi:channel protein (hemolysin III family)